MTRSDRSRRIHGASVVPFDLALAVGVAIGTFALVLANPGFRTSAEPLGIASAVLPLIGVFAGLTLLLLLPGYAVTAAILPNRQRDPVADDRGGPSLTTVERLALSTGLSIVIAALIGLAISWTPLEYSRETAGMLLTLLVLLGGLVGTLRGHVSPIDHRSLTIRRLVRGPTSSLSKHRRDRLASVVLSLSIILALGSLSVALVTPHSGESFTGFSVLSETAEGVDAAAAYPEQVTQHDSASFVLVVQNHESERVPYTVIVREERVARGAGGVELLAANELARMSTEVPVGATTERRLEVTPTMTGTELRLGFYLYRGAVPAEPTPATAYRFLYIWIDVVAGSGQDGPSGAP